MTHSSRKPLMRSLGEFFGHIVKGIRTDPAADSEKQVVNRTVEEEDRGDVILRRTTIDEVEIRKRADSSDTATETDTDSNP